MFGEAAAEAGSGTGDQHDAIQKTLTHVADSLLRITAMLGTRQAAGNGDQWRTPAFLSANRRGPVKPGAIFWDRARS